MIFARSEKQYRPRATVIPDAYVNNCITRLRVQLHPVPPLRPRRGRLLPDYPRLASYVPFKGIDEQLLDIQIRRYIIPLFCSSTARFKRRENASFKCFLFFCVEENRKSHASMLFLNVIDQERNNHKSIIIIILGI